MQGIRDVKKDNKTEIVIKLLNVQGLTQAKSIEVEQRINNSTIVCLTETQQKRHNIKFQKNIRNVSQMRTREDRKGGGLMILWDDKMGLEVEKLESNHQDLLTAKLKLNDEVVIMILVYFSVKDEERNEDIKSKISAMIEKYQNEEWGMILLGDFNGHIGFIGEQQLNKNGQIILNLMERHNLVLLNDNERCHGKVTWQERNMKSTIDYMMVNEKMYNKFEKMVIDEQKEEIDFSDHNLIAASFYMKRKRNIMRDKGEKQIMKINEETKNLFKHTLRSKMETAQQLISLSEFNGMIKETSQEVMIKTIRIRENQRKQEEPIWFNMNIKKEISKRREINKKRRNATNVDEKVRLDKEYNIQKAKVNDLVQDTVEKYEINLTEKILKDRNKSKNMWQHMNTLRKLNKNDKKEIKIYKENGEEVDQNQLGTELKNNWLPIYQAWENNIESAWNEREKEKYIEETNRGIVNHRYQTGWRYSAEQRIIIPQMETRQFSEQLIEHMDMAFRISHVYKMNEPEITVEDVKKQINKMKTGKASGPDEVKVELYKCLCEDDDLVLMLKELLNEVLTTGIIPEEWKTSRTVLIEKKPKPKANELRPIALMNTHYKIFMGIIKEKIEKHMESNELINNYQAGSTKNRRVADNLFILQYCIEESFKMKKEMYVISIDYSKAFDSVIRAELIETLKKCKVHENIIEIISKIYRGDKTELTVNGKKYVDIDVTSGIRQGCNGSPLLFILVTYQIIERLKNLNKGFKQRDVQIPALFYVDDGLIFANSKEEAHKLVDEIEKISCDYGLKLNRSKCKILVYNRKSEIQSINGIEVVDEIKYLGVKIGNKRDCFKPQKQLSKEKAARMNNILFSVLGNSCNRLLIGKTFWKGLAIPSFLYAQEIMCYTKTELESLQREDNKAYRTILQLPIYTPVEFLRGEVGASSMWARDIKSKLLFVKHALREGGNVILKKVMEKTIEDNNSKLAKVVTKYMEQTSMSKRDLTNLSINQIKKKVKEMDSEFWREGLERKSTLSIYREKKEDIEEVKWFRNGRKYQLMMRARSNTLGINWRKWGTEEEKICDLCGEGEETLLHFVIECRQLQQTRNKCRMLQRPCLEQKDKIMEEVLIIDGSPKEEQK